MNKDIIEILECPKCDKEFKTKTTLNVHLQKTHGYGKLEATEYCKNLNIITISELRSQCNIKDTCLKRYGTTNGGGIPSALEKQRETFIKKYGVDHNFKSEEVKSKIRQTNIERYGVEVPTQCVEIQSKIKQTNLKRYGYEYGLSSPVIQSKIDETNMKRIGVKRPCQTETSIDKMRTTQFTKFGRWYSQTDKHHKSNYRWKEYNLPSGKTVKCQGYEPLALDILLNDHIEDDIIIDMGLITESSCEFWYEYDNSQHRYFPDIYIPSKKLIIEVKSEYTYSQQTHKNEAKRQCCIDNGYYFQFWVFNTKHELVKII